MVGVKWRRRIAPHTLQGLWLPAVAVPLFIILGALQFHWLSELSQRDLESRRTRLAADVQRFGMDVDRELLLAYLAFQFDVTAIARRDGREASNRYQAWQAQSRFPGLIRSVWIAEQAGAVSLPRDSLFAHFGDAPKDPRVQAHNVPPQFGPAPAPASASERPAVRTVRISMYSLAGGRPLSGFVRPTSWRFLHLDVDRQPFDEYRLPPSLDSLRQRFSAPRTPALRGVDEHDPFSNPLDEATLSIIVPLAVEVHAASTALKSPGVGKPHMEIGPSSSSALRFAILQLDRAYISGDLLPALAKQYFAPASASAELEYRLAVVRAKAPHGVVYASHPTRDSGLPAVVDASAPLFGIRPPNANDALAMPYPAGVTRRLDAAVVPAGTGLFGTLDRPARGYWQLRAAHRTGSLEALAAQTRLRNLLASGALLALLGGSLVLMLVALRRARELARQQMEFVATISHELRTPVAVVSMTGANLADGLVRDPDQVRHYGRLIQREGRRLNEMTEQVLSLARIESASVPAIRPVAVDGLIRRALQSMRHQIDEQRFSCHEDIDPHLPLVLADANSLERALQNLIGNALKYSGERREIRVTAGTHDTSAGTRVRIAVEDRGIGIEADELSLIFEPFRRGRVAIDRNLPGTGLGLSLVLRIVQVHGGHVHVRSKPGVGSTFTLDLPAARTSTVHDATVLNAPAQHAPQSTAPPSQ